MHFGQQSRSLRAARPPIFRRPVCLALAFALGCLLCAAACPRACADDADKARQIALRTHAALNAAQAVSATFTRDLLSPTSPSDDRPYVQPSTWRLLWLRDVGWRLECPDRLVEICRGERLLLLDKARRVCELRDCFDPPLAVLRRVHLLEDVAAGPPPYPRVGYNAFFRAGPPTFSVREDSLGRRPCFVVQLSYAVDREKSARFRLGSQVQAERITYFLDRQSFLPLRRTRELFVAGEWKLTDELKDVAYDDDVRLPLRALSLQPPPDYLLADLRTHRAHPATLKVGARHERSDLPFPEGGAACNAASWWQWFADQVLDCQDAAQWRVVVHGLELLANNEMFVYLTRWNKQGAEYWRDVQPDVVCRDERGRVFVSVLGAEHISELWKIWLVPLAAATYDGPPPEQLTLTVRPFPQSLAPAPDEPSVVFSALPAPEPLGFAVPPRWVQGMDKQQREQFLDELAQRKAQARQLFLLRKEGG